MEKKEEREKNNCKWYEENYIETKIKFSFQTDKKNRLNYNINEVDEFY